MAEIREITLDDAETVAGLLRRGFRDVAERFGFTREREPRFPAYIAAERIEVETNEGTRFFLLEAEGKPQGCVGMRIEEDQCWMVRLAVAPEFRHQGLGRALTEHVERESWRLGFRKLDVAVVAENERLCNWYRGLGYKDREIKRYGYISFTVLYMFKEASNG